MTVEFTNNSRVYYEWAATVFWDWYQESKKISLCMVPHLKFEEIIHSELVYSKKI